MSTMRLRQSAVFVVLAFVLGTTAIPTLHLFFHALPHDHSAGKVFYHVDPPPDASEQETHHQGREAHGHDHTEEGGHHHHDGAPPSHGHPDPSSDPRHGEGSSGHFSLALSDAPASAFTLSFLGLNEAGDIVPRLPAPTPSAHVSVQRFRGPPARG